MYIHIYTCIYKYDMRIQKEEKKKEERNSRISCMGLATVYFLMITTETIKEFWLYL